MPPFDNAMPSPVVTPAPPTPAPTAPAVAQPPTPAPSTGPAPQPALPPNTQTVTDPNAPSGMAEPKHGALGDIFQDIAGGKKTIWRQTPQGPVAFKTNQGPGDMARAIVAAALTGLAGGYMVHGPNAAGKAFGAGFQAEGEAQQKTADDAQKSAQTKFKNTQAADELTLRKATNARDQLRSIDEHQEATIRIQSMNQQLAEGKFREMKEHTDFLEQQYDKYNTLIKLGAKPLTGSDGKPIPEFKDNDELVKWMHTGNNAAIAIKPGRYNTVIATDPVTGNIQILQKPQGWDDPQWIGVKVDSNGQPVRDKDGNVQPDGSMTDLITGKTTAPSGMMTPHQFNDYKIKQIEAEAHLMTLTEAKLRLENTRLERQKNMEQKDADDQLNKANGDPDALDPKTHSFIVTPASRTILMQRFQKDLQNQSNALNAGERELDRIDPKDPEFQNIKDYLQSNMTNLFFTQAMLLKLSRTPNVMDTLAKSMRDEYTQNGAYDQDNALKSVPKDLPAAQQQYLRGKLTGDGIPPQTPEVIQKMVAAGVNLMNQGKTIDEVVNLLSRAGNISQSDKQILTAEFKKASKNPAQVTNQGGNEEPSGPGGIEALKAIGRGVAGAAKGAAKFVENTPVEPTPQQ